MNTASLQIDLTRLFAPAIADGIATAQSLQNTFTAAQSEMQKLKDQKLLGYADLPFDEAICRATRAATKSFEGIKNIVVFGIGGSALGTQSIDYALRGALAKSPKLFVVDHIEPMAYADLKNTIDAQDTLFVFISKSGDTSETLAQYLYFRKHFPRAKNENIFIITDPHKGYLRELAGREKMATLPVPPGVGGRFSVFSAVGLMPLAVAGIPIEELLDGARAMQTFCNTTTLAENPAALMAMSWHHWLVGKKFTQAVMMPYSDRLRYFSDWFAQLFGESLGKRVGGENVGFTPIKALGVTDQHSQLQLYLEGPRDKIISFVEIARYADDGALGQAAAADDRIDFLQNKSLTELMRAEKRATEEALREAGRPNQTLLLPELNAYSLGALYQLFMNVVPWLGAALKLNPFDQPAVERIKRLTFGLMGRTGFAHEVASFANPAAGALGFLSDEKL